jgi:hypothetical protein
LPVVLVALVVAGPAPPLPPEPEVATMVVAVELVSVVAVDDEHAAVAARPHESEKRIAEATLRGGFWFMAGFLLLKRRWRPPYH